MLTAEEVVRIQLESIRREAPTITTPEALELRAKLDRDRRPGKGMAAAGALDDAAPGDRSAGSNRPM